jgi:hypothetical protein
LTSRHLLINLTHDENWAATASNRNPPWVYLPRGPAVFGFPISSHLTGSVAWGRLSSFASFSFGNDQDRKVVEIRP